MPFTLGHPAAVIPIHSRYKWISLSSLIVGSLVPDAAYYLPMPERFRENAHTLFGAFYSLPIGIVFLLIFYFVAPGIVPLLPSPHREALLPKLQVSTISPREALMAVCGIVIGAETHVLWDSLTHGEGWLLRTPFVGHRLSIDFALEVLSSIAGMWFLLYLYDRWIAAEQGARLWSWRPSWRLYLWLAVLMCCFAAAMIESHTIQAVTSFDFLRSGHFGLVLVTSFIRNLLLASCAIGISARILGLDR